ncbi:MAG TPA: sigma-70 family RNA polymerase sigma factor [Bacteroidales bacterium]|nr:sigma-70 family RNA polymerase sigma factor [Bacteroidales bacterium]HOK99621.1 sigma-70 family RNA polymerase sigma factor [Bacteroidales bacterium]HPO66453.1 sigma-70 family RNA polymerase sigma factor [Bacteroidales bacterium]
MYAERNSNKRLNDEDIVTLVLAGRTDLFALLVDRYKDRVFQTCMGFLHNRQEAEDLAQEIFIQVYVSLSGFKRRSAFSTWLYRIVINAALNMLRKKSKIAFVDLTTLNSSHFAMFKNDRDNPEQVLIETEDNSLLKEALDSLPDKQRAAIVLSYFNEMSQKEIAQVLDTTEGAVESLLQRAKKNLRKKLGESRRKNEQ